MRRLRPVLGIAGAALLATLAVTGCASASAASSIVVASAYIPQPTTPGTTVAYLDIRNNGPADTLISAQTSVGGKVQLRAPAGRQAGTLIMRTVPDIPLPAHSMTLLLQGLVVFTGSPAQLAARAPSDRSLIRSHERRRNSSRR